MASKTPKPSMIRSIRAKKVLPLILMSVATAGQAQQHAGTNPSVAAALAQQRQSLFAQRASLKRQIGNANFTAFLGTTFYGSRAANYLPVSFSCPPLDFNQREDLIFEAARDQAIEPALVRAVMHRESAFHPCAVSTKGAVGLMQLMPATLARFHVRDPFDPAQSVHAGAALLRTLLDKYDGDLRLTLAAYNAGSARIENADPTTYPSETKNYITDILAELGIEPTSAGKSIE